MKRREDSKVAVGGELRPRTPRAYDTIFSSIIEPPSPLAPRPPPADVGSFFLSFQVRRLLPRRRRHDHCRRRLLSLLPPSVPMSSSPFRASHRRSRSHTSLTSPSSSPVTRFDNNRNHSPRSPFLIGRQPCGASAVPSRSPFSCASVLAAQPPEKWDVEAWRRGKRARRDPEVCRVSYLHTSALDHSRYISRYADHPRGRGHGVL